MAAGAMTERAVGRKVTMVRVTFAKGQEQNCSVCLNSMQEGVRCNVPGKFILICGTCVTAMGIVLGQ